MPITIKLHKSCIANARRQRGDYTAKKRVKVMPVAHDILLPHMKKLIRPAIIFAITIFIVLSCAMIAFSTKPPVINNSADAAFFVQTTPSPPVEEDRSEVGSTDEIIIMGGVIVAIVLIPIILQRKAWMQNNNS